MEVLVPATTHPLADLAATLTATLTADTAPPPAGRVAAVLDAAVRAAAGMTGDAAAVRLAGVPGPAAVHHADPDRAAALARLLAETGDTDHPVVLDTGKAGPAGFAAVVVCPLRAGDGHLGYLALARTGTGEADVDLARGIAGEVALALTTARSIELMHTADERYRRLVDTALEGVWQLDADGVTVAVNEPMADLLGLPAQQLAGRPADEFLAARDRVELHRWLADGDGDRTVHRTQLVRPDGGVRRVQLATTPLPGDPGGAVCMVTDVTEQEHGRGLKRQLDHLRRLDSLGQLIGGIAHDFNNLFTVVAGSADVIAAEAPRGSTPHQLATEIVDAAVRGRSLAHQLLAFGRAGGHNETVNVPDLLSSVTHLLCRTIGEHIRLDITVPDDLWPVRAERGPLEQVLVNVAANARDSMPRGGVLTISAANTTLEPGHLDAPLAGRVVRLVLADTGTGMDQQTRAHAFEPFYTTKPTAAGLGLTTALNVVSACGGHIRLESTPRLGTTVEIYLPAAERPAQPAAVPADRAADPGHGHVLVVEDQPELAKLIQYLLQPAGYTVTTTTDPHAALARCGPDVHVDLLLTDVIMAGMTGPDLAGALCERYPDLRVVYMTGYPSGDLGPHANLDDEDVLRKPFTRETLLAALERAPAGTRKGNGNTPERKR